MSKDLKRELLTFDNEADWLDVRLRDITSTDCAALFGQSPYKTVFQVYHSKKRNIISKFEPNERMNWGNRLEGIIARGLGEDHGFEVENMGEYIRIPELRIGSSFDYRIGSDVLFEIKNVSIESFRDWWTFDKDSAAAPPHIEIQVQHQLAVSGYRHAYIGALVGGNSSYMLRRERNEELIGEIFSRTKKFWEAFDAGEAPDPDLFKDHRTIADLYSRCEPGTVALADDHIDTLARAYRRVSKDITRLDADKKRIKSELLMAIGETEKTMGSNYSISAPTQESKEISYTRKAFRNFRINYKAHYDESEGITDDQ